MTGAAEREAVLVLHHAAIRETELELRQDAIDLAARGRLDAAKTLGAAADLVAHALTLLADEAAQPPVRALH